MNITAEELKYFAKNFLRKVTVESSQYLDMARLTTDPRLHQTAKSIAQMSPQEISYINKIAKLAMDKEIVRRLTNNRGLTVGLNPNWFHDLISGLLKTIANEQHNSYFLARMEEAVKSLENE